MSTGHVNRRIGSMGGHSLMTLRTLSIYPLPSDASQLVLLMGSFLPSFTLGIE